MANHYDRILKEHIEPLYAFIARRMGVDMNRAEIIKDKAQKTLEREADFVVKALHNDSDEDFIFHLEFQTDDFI